jgi:hypothetical protein
MKSEHKNLVESLKNIDISKTSKHRQQKNKEADEIVSSYQVFTYQRNTINRNRRLPPEWEKIFTIYSSDKGLVSGEYKEFTKILIQILI